MAASGDFKLYAVSLLRAPAPQSGGEATLLCTADDVSSFPFMARGTARDALLFVSRTVAGRMQPGSKLSLMDEKEGEDRRVFASAGTDGLVCVVTANDKYPLRVGFQLIQAVVADFQKQFADKWRDAPEKKGGALKWPQLEAHLKKYQNPASVDRILQVQGQIEETKVLMLDNIDAVMRRGEKIEDLVAGSEDLSVASKGFYRAAKKTNKRCRCSIM
eukprot:TRINITY_DN14736_c6_g1_i1.p1 TRINITY_DN14736_c6_g1~~TRINITY_DN14736_c6_g1_i1.p1  ORF type:complete len:217 (+),score=96.10 TRINITY_DN14736_c6_g1_i1:78-728(+)